MREGKRISVVIPAQDEEAAIAKVIKAVPSWVDDIVVVDNASADATDERARVAGARVVHEPEVGYGAACLAGIAALRQTDIVVFVDGDHSDHPEDMASLVDPILSDHADLVIGSRALGGREPGSMMPQQLFGNWLATRLICLLWGGGYTDLGPFRAVSAPALARLGVADRTYGWTVEMQIKAIEKRLVILEVPARYRRRIGVSKISGTVRGTVMAGIKILSIIGRHGLRRLADVRREE